MRKYVKCIALMLVCMSPALLLSGCGTDHNVENQAYAVMLGADLTDEGVELTIQAPKISSGGEYLKVSASAPDFQSALDALSLATPRYLNLSQLTLMIVSEELASSAYMPAVLELLKTNYRIFNAASFVVCEGKAKDFVNKQQPVFGERLSTGLSAMLESYQELGYSPKCTIADMYYLYASELSDPFAILSAIVKGGGGEAVPGESGPEEFTMESENKNMYMGAALMRDGRMVGKLTGLETVFVNLIRGEVEGFSYTASGLPVQLIALKKPDVDISIENDGVSIDIRVKMTMLSLNGEASVKSVSESLERDMLETVNICRANGTDPFGFAEIAARGFLTLERWREFNWREKFADAEINIEVTLTPIG